MHKIINRTNSPFDLQGINGNVRVPAFGEVEGEFSGEYVDILRSSGAVSVEQIEHQTTKEEAAIPAEPVDPETDNDTETADKLEDDAEVTASDVPAASDETAKPREVEDSDSDAKPLDHLRAEYLSLSGKKADNRWGDARLQSEIDKLKGGE